MQQFCLSTTVRFFFNSLFVFSSFIGGASIYAQGVNPPGEPSIVDDVVGNLMVPASSAVHIGVVAASRESSSAQTTSVVAVSIAAHSSVAKSSRADASVNTTSSGAESSSVELSSANDSSVASSMPEVSISFASSSAQAEANVISSEAVAVSSSAAPAVTDSFAVSKFILDTEVKPNTSVRLTWSSDTAVGAFSEATPVLVVNGANPGKTLCLTAAVHGDELNGIEMIRRVMFDIEPAKLNGTIIGVPVANIMGFRRNSRYLPDRRDWNRYFPGNTYGSSASRLAHSFFSKIIMHCDSLVDLHTGSFHRTNLPQLRADLSDENVARLAQSFGVIAVLNSRGNPSSLRTAAVRAGIPSVTLEAGEPMAMQRDVVEQGVAALNTLLAKTGMYGKQKRWNRIAPVYYRSTWVRANQSGILFSTATLGQRVKEGDTLGTVTDPITNARTTIKSPYAGRVIGMALDQVVLPGFAAYHIGIQTPEAILIEESQMNQTAPEEDEEDGDDSGVDSTDEMEEPETGVSKAQDRMADE
ncbi:MAG TPA: succinylglutamate desuccinylase/aspartoacylase family protein [Cellvibrio sp.]